MTAMQDIASPSSPNVIINIDYTHVARRASGIERITLEQFSEKTLAPLAVRTHETSRNRFSVLLAQMVGMPLHALSHPNEIYVFPGFPPSPYFALVPDRSVLFVHDLFLLTRREDLNGAGKYYLSPMFHIAVRNFRYFLTNSQETARRLRAYCNPTAKIVCYRPYVGNIFDLTWDDRATRPDKPDKWRIVSIGTIEPRKNYGAAVQICQALSQRLGRNVELHIIGRFGWGQAISDLRSHPNVVLHGYLDDETARSIISQSDLLLCTSHDEGLGLPLIEVQYSGMPVVAPDKEIFKEVLGSSGILVQPDAPDEAAKRIADAMTSRRWRSIYAEAARANIVRWNAIAESDRAKVISFLAALASRSGRAPVNELGM